MGTTSGDVDPWAWLTAVNTASQTVSGHEPARVGVHVVADHDGVWWAMLYCAAFRIPPVVLDTYPVLTNAGLFTLSTGVPVRTSHTAFTADQLDTVVLQMPTGTVTVLEESTMTSGAAVVVFRGSKFTTRVQTVLVAPNQDQVVSWRCDGAHQPVVGFDADARIQVMAASIRE